AAARTARRHPAARAALPPAGVAPLRPPSQDALRRRPRRVRGLPLAGQRPGAEERGGAADDPLLRRRDPPRGPSRRDPRRRAGRRDASRRRSAEERPRGLRAPLHPGGPAPPPGKHQPRRGGAAGGKIESVPETEVLRDRGRARIRRTGDQWAVIGDLEGKVLSALITNHKSQITNRPQSLSSRSRISRTWLDEKPSS